MERSLTMLDSGLVGYDTLDRILQAVVFFADSIAIRSSYQVAPTDRADAALIERRVLELRDQGFVKLWAHEYEVGDSGEVNTPNAADGARRPSDLVLPTATLGAGLGEMDEVMRSVRELAYGGESQAPVTLRQGTAEIVGLRNHLASLVISSELNQDGMLTNPAVRTALTRSFRSGGESFQNAVVQDVIAQMQLGSLTRLTADQVEECRRFSRDFRLLLDESLLAVARGVDPVLTPVATAQEIMNRYRAISAEYALPQLGPEIGGEIIWDVLGATIPASILLKYGTKAFRWRRVAQEIRPYLLLMHLERSLYKGGKPRA
ncbi:hypothetical protein ACGFIW_30230 [Micromonospora sp. NPDC048935]|uniref:hypothetical protein n=1 Tax=Micromonospora sp. NPDC048935 TaxID=3364262 RepID=UPI00371845D6